MAKKAPRGHVDCVIKAFAKPEPFKAFMGKVMKPLLDEQERRDRALCAWWDRLSPETRYAAYEVVICAYRDGRPQC